jgi:thymidylate synthase
MYDYSRLLRVIMEQGRDVADRTGTGTRSIFGHQMRFNLEDGFPAVTTKRLAWKSVVGELLWFLEGSTDERRLAELTYGKSREWIEDKNTIWTANANKQGVDLGYQNHKFYKELGPVYGSQWRDFNGFDQLEYILDEITHNPDSRRIILNAWNASEVDEMTLPPCHVMAQFRVYDGKLSCQLYQRSADVFLGVPFNIASYALLTHIIARHCNLGVGELIHTLGDAHIYNDHFEQVEEQLGRSEYDLPQLEIDDSFDLNCVFDMDSEYHWGSFGLNDADKIKLTNYMHHDTIKANMSV